MKCLTYFKIKIWHNIPEEVCSKLIKKYHKNIDDYYRVIIFDNFEDMYNYADKHFDDKPPIEHNYSGICKYSSKVYYIDGEFVDIDKCCGWILLHKDQMGGGTVSHECGHATTFYFKYRINNCKRVFEDDEYNELFSYILGGLVNQIYTKVYKKKIL